MAVLVYRGGATLTFGSGSGRRSVKREEPFEVSDELAEILLVDPAVSMVEAAEPVVEEAVKPAGLDAFKALRSRAKELGIPAVGKAPALAAAIAAEEERLADEAIAMPVAVPAEPEPAAGPGAITLGDLPSGARISHLPPANPSLMES